MRDTMEDMEADKGVDTTDMMADMEADKGVDTTDIIAYLEADKGVNTTDIMADKWEDSALPSWGSAPIRLLDIIVDYIADPVMIETKSTTIITTNILPMNIIPITNLTTTTIIPSMTLTPVTSRTNGRPGMVTWSRGATALSKPMVPLEQSTTLPTNTAASMLWSRGLDTPTTPNKNTNLNHIRLNNINPNTTTNLSIRLNNTTNLSNKLNNTTNLNIINLSIINLNITTNLKNIMHNNITNLSNVNMNNIRLKNNTNLNKTIIPTIITLNNITNLPTNELSIVILIFFCIPISFYSSIFIFNVIKLFHLEQMCANASCNLCL